MADNPQAATTRPRPLSPYLTIYRWPITMATSITHRVTGLGLSLGMIFLSWWLIGIASGPDVYKPFVDAATSVPGLVVIFGFTWSLVYHFLNGIRHLAWDLGYGFAVPTADRTGLLVVALSIVITGGMFAFALMAPHGAMHP